jgi:hypothetical protein
MPVKVHGGVKVTSDLDQGDLSDFAFADHTDYSMSYTPDVGECGIIKIDTAYYGEAEFHCLDCGVVLDTYSHSDTDWAYYFYHKTDATTVAFKRFRSKNSADPVIDCLEITYSSYGELVGYTASISLQNDSGDIKTLSSMGDLSGDLPHSERTELFKISDGGAHDNHNGRGDGENGGEYGLILIKRFKKSS